MFFGWRWNFVWGTENLVCRVFQIALRGKGKILSLSRVDDEFCRGDFLLGGGNLMRSDFDHWENCYLVGGNEHLVGGTKIFLEGGGGGRMSKFSASGGGGGTPSHSSSRAENPVKWYNLQTFFSFFQNFDFSGC